MSKQWFYEVMGSPVGPITSAELKSCVLAKRILPETRIRLGDDGKWQTADRVKGLFDGHSSTPSRPAAEAKPVALKAATPTVTAETGTAEISTLQTAEVKIPVAAVTPALHGQASHTPADEETDTEYDFFKFVGFEIAIGHALNNALMDYCRQHHVTMTQTTRRALAQFLGRKDLATDAGPESVPAPAVLTTPLEPSGVG
jgi:hypothetical protein